MRTVAAVAVLALAAVALAGCASEDPLRYPEGVSSSGSRSSGATTGSSSSTATSTGPAGNGTGNGTGGNRAPTGSLSVAVNGTLARFNLTGTDQDNDTLSWTLAFGDGNATNGTALPASLNHTYAPGNYSVLFTLDDGQANATYNATLTVVAGGGGVVQDVDFSYAVGGAMCADAPPQMTFGTPAQDVFWSEWAIDPATIGAAYTVDFTAANPALAIGEMAFYDAEGARIEVNASTTPVLGTVPAGAAMGMFVDCAAGPVEGHYHAG